ncbi:MAG: efflux RND transporter permease subunit [Thermodesulfobacteriota bacterium]
MKAAIAWMSNNHVAANLLMFFFIVGGLLVGMHITQEVFPDINLDEIEVSVVYPGAGPEEVEEGIIQKIEENLSGVDGIKELRSLAMEGMAMVTAEIRGGGDANEILQDIKNEVDRIHTFPLEAERPVIRKLVRVREVLSVAVYGELSPRGLREMADEVRDDLLALPEITQAELSGVPPYEISIEISEHKLRSFDLTLEQVARRVRQASLDLPAGTIKAKRGEILIRTKERRYLAGEYGDIVIKQQPDGTELRLADLGRVIDGFEDTDEFAIFDGQPAALIQVFRVGAETPKGISKAVYRYIDSQDDLPPSVQLAVWKDRSEMLSSRMNLLLKNGFFGLILVLIILSFFLEIRLALWVMLGIPISFLGTFIFMPALGASINMISLFAFIMALGIVVDDAIVVGENIYSHRRDGRDFAEAAVAGAWEVATPVTFAILTSVAAFIPLLLVSGTMGKFIGTIPKVVIVILVASLVECLFILPAHLTFKPRREEGNWLVKTINSGTAGFNRHLRHFIDGPYKRFLRLCLANRYITLSAGIAVLLLAVGIMGGGLVKFRFMPKIESDTIKVMVEMPAGTTSERTLEIQRFIEEKAGETIRHFDQRHPGEGSLQRHLYTTISNGGAMAMLSLNLIPGEERQITSNAITKHWRQLVGDIPGVESLTFANNMVHLGANIDIRLSHDDYQILEEAAARIIPILQEYPGVGDITNSLKRGKRELKVRLLPEGRTLGLTEEELGRQLRAAFYGAEALRLQRGRHELRVMVRYPDEERRHLWNFEQMRIKTTAGEAIPLYQASAVEESLGFNQINRSERRRVTNLTGSVDAKVANAEEILMALQHGVLAEMQDDYPGLIIDLEGESKERKESLSSMRRGLGFALLAIYCLLAIPLRSYIQPMLIMIAIPFGVVGAILGHMILGYSIAIMSMFGIVALAGVVVNDSLLLIDFINGHRRAGQTVEDAVVLAGQRRFRPILLTSLTTFFGLGPIILETSTQAQFLIPMAISLAFGILFSTIIALIYLPSLYLILEDIKGLFIRDQKGGDA